MTGGGAGERAEGADGDVALFAAYRATTFEAETPQGRLRLRIGEPSPELDDLLRRHGVGEWAFVTAENPGSVPLPPAENDVRTRELRAALEREGWKVYAGRGLPDEPGWEPEESFLVLGPSTVEARALGRRFGQNAVVVGAIAGPARLLDCRPARS